MKALPFCWRKKILNMKPTLNKSYIPIFDPNSLSFKNLHNITTKELYWILWKHQKPKRYNPAAICKWNEIFTIQKEDWTNIFLTPYLTFKGVFYQCFQYKIIHRIIACRDWLSTLKVIDSPSCLYCDDKDTILHFFVYCPLVTQFWNSFMLWWNKLVSACASLDEIIIIFGVKIDGETAITFNYCLILAKHFIYTKRLTKSPIDFYSFLPFLKSKLMEEYDYYMNNSQLDTFMRTRGLVFNNL